MTPTWRHPVALSLGALAFLFLLANLFVIVPEQKQAVILQFSKPIGTYNPYRPGEQLGRTTGAGLKFVPFWQQVVWVDKRVLGIDLPEQQVLSVDQQRLKVDAFARFRIVRPVLMVVSAGSEEEVKTQLAPILGSALRNELGKREFAALLSPERGQVMKNIQGELDRVASQYGAQIVDVRIKQAELPSGSPLDSALNRMRSARVQEAQTVEAQGIRQARVVRAEADAQAAQIYAQSFGKDPSFYDFWRAMQSYRRTFGVDGQTTTGESAIILSPDNDYLRQFEGRGR